MQAREKIHVGIAGWSYPDWKGVVYPAQTPRGFSSLAHVAACFDVVEINSSFYRPVSAGMAARWVEQVRVNPRFLFTAKLWQRFTHERDEPWTAAEVGAVKEGFGPLQEAGLLGALLLQFPWSFRATEENLDWLGRVSEQFGEFPRVVEVRHVSWDTPEAKKELRRRKLNFCNIDQPHFAGNIGHTSLATGPIAYYRFHGRNAKAWFTQEGESHERYNYLYTAEELAPWARDIAAMCEESEVQKIFVVANNHYLGKGPTNALQLKAALTGEKVRVPETLLDAYPVLKPIALPPAGQGSLAF